MISEVENIKKGLVVATVEFDTAKKIIGVSTTNLVPSPTGIAPLEKQNAFQVPVVAETVDFSQAITQVQEQVPVQETIQIDLPVLDSAQTNNGLKAPVTSDVISENPVQVENPSNLTGFDMPSIEAVQEEAPEVVETEQVAIDIQMPEMPSVVVADEPSGLNESLFEGAEIQPTQSILEEQPVVAEEIAPAVEETVQPEQPIENVEMEVTPAVETVQEVVEQPAPVEENIMEVIPTTAPVEENIMEAIPTTAPAEEIPAFNIEMPVPSEEVVETPAVVEQKVEEVAPVVDTPVQEEIVSEVVENVQTEIIQENEPVLETQENVQEAAAVNTNNAKIELINGYKEALEKIQITYQKAVEDIFNEFVKKYEQINEKENTMENKVVETVEEELVPIEETIVEQTPVAIEQPAPVQQPQIPVVPANPLENDAFQIIDAMSAPKM